MSTTWLDLAHAAQHRLNGYAGDIEGAAVILEGLDAPKTEMLRSIAYLALQVQAYRRISNEDAALALSQIRTTIRNYDERRPEATA